MIPKTIHYCWFGRGPLPEKAKKCIASWKKYCPDYEIVEWNEDNFDVACNDYVREAYESRRFAFVTDYVRLAVLCRQGGVYMDTDVEVLRPLDEFLLHRAFSGFETPDSVPTGIMACEAGFPLFEEYLAYYEGKHFLNPDGSPDCTTNVVTMTRITEGHGLRRDGTFQILDGYALYPKEYFCPLDNATGVLERTEKTATIHWFAKSWVEPKKRLRSRITRVFHRLFGVDCFAGLKRLLGKGED